jgi:hypothetical protein
MNGSLNNSTRSQPSAQIEESSQYANSEHFAGKLR